MPRKPYRFVVVQRGSMSYKRRQPLHHRINKKVLKSELKRLEEEKEVIEENMRKAKRRASGQVVA